MAQKVVGYVKLQIPAGKATPAPPVGPALGQHGVNIAAFTKEFNERTKNDMRPDHPCGHHRLCRPLFHLYHQDPSRSGPDQEGSATLSPAPASPTRTKVATISKASVQKIAEMKMPDLNAASIEAAMSMIAGTCTLHGRCRRDE